MYDTPKGRRKLLQEKFDECGLLDATMSDMCMQYIYLGDRAFQNNVDAIVTSLAQSQFLEQYCDRGAGVRMARDQCKYIRLPRDQWLERVQTCTLECSGLSDFPEIWPWLECKHIRGGGTAPAWTGRNGSRKGRNNTAGTDLNWRKRTPQRVI